MSTTYESCIASSGGDDSLALQCISSALDQSMSNVKTTVNTVSEDITTVENELLSLKIGVDIFFLLFAATIMFVMQAGFAMLCAGSVQAKNLQNTIMKNILDACGKYYFVGGVAAYKTHGGYEDTQKQLLIII